MRKQRRAAAVKKADAPQIHKSDEIETRRAERYVGLRIHTSSVGVNCDVSSHYAESWGSRGEPQASWSRLQT